MITLRNSKDRGHINHGWLNAKHSFSFGDYYDPKNMGFSALRVINEDIVEPGEGFPTHGHKNMEIITYIIEGALEHKDSMGSGSVIRPGDLQYMSAGAGVLHSEFNHSKTERVHLLQIWILPSETGGKPAYAEKHFSKESRLNQLRLVVSPDSYNQAPAETLPIKQNAKIYASLLEAGKEINHAFVGKRKGWIQVVKGSILINSKESLTTGDGAMIEEEFSLHFKANEDSEFLFFDLPASL